MGKIALGSFKKENDGATHMGKMTLTPKQQLVFDEVKKSDFLKKNFYFTGGTALAWVYLQHRLSEDLDFFSPEKFDNLSILNLLTEWGEKHNFKFLLKENEVVKIYLLEFADGEKLKVDFGYYPYPRVRKGKSIESVQIDSLFDIAINKLSTIMQRTEVKDFVDLYFLLKEFTLWDLMEGVGVKFRIKADPYLVGINCLKMETFDTLPNMLIPVTLSELKDFYKNLAKKLGMKATV